jgi:bifunctional pyridoxal-dependent enzyme with beta-cystathionase and maltose regulon repressor activities
LSEGRGLLDANHDFVQDYLADRIPLLFSKKPEGTFLVWLDVTQVAERIHAKGVALEANARNRRARPTSPRRKWWSASS